MSMQYTSRCVPRAAEVRTQNLGEAQSCVLVIVLGQCGRGLAPGISMAYTGIKVSMSKKECDCNSTVTNCFSEAIKSATEYPRYVSIRVVCAVLSGGASWL